MEVDVDAEQALAAIFTEVKAEGESANEPPILAIEDGSVTAPAPMECEEADASTAPTIIATKQEDGYRWQ